MDLIKIEKEEKDYSNIIGPLIAIVVVVILIFSGFYHDHFAKEFCIDKDMNFYKRDGTVAICNLEDTYSPFYYKSATGCRLHIGDKVITREAYKKIDREIKGTIIDQYVTHRGVCKIKILEGKDQVIELTEAWVRGQ